MATDAADAAAAAAAAAGAGAEEDAAAARFVALTGATADQAAFMLEASHGDLDSAVQMYFDSHPPPDHGGHAAAAAMTGDALRDRRHHHAPPPPRPRAGFDGVIGAGPPPPPARQHGNRRSGGGGGLFALPVRLVAAGIHALASVVQLTLTVAAAVGDRVLPPAVMRSARGVVRGLLAAAAAADPPDPALQASAFSAAFEAKYGRQHPAWVAEGWRAAAAAAHQQFKLLLVYLHAPEHQDADAFAASVLCSQEVCDYVNEHFVCWGGDVRQPDAFALAGRLNVSTYPAVALLAFSGARTKLAALAQGGVRAPALLAALRRAADEQGVLLTAERLEREERELSRRLLEEQNAEYEASLAADRAREAARAEARRADEEAARRAEEAAARARAEAEAAEQRRQQAAATIAARRRHKAAALAPEPPPGAPGAATIRVRLPSGAQQTRRFDGASATVGALFDWVDSLEHCDAARYSLVCAFPKRVFGADADAGLSLADAGLAPQGALFVQAHADDDEDGEVGA